MDKSMILNKLQEYKKIKNKSQFAKFLGISSQKLNNWYQRNRFSSNDLLLKFPEINPEWLLTGEGEMLRDGDAKKLYSSNSVYGLGNKSQTIPFYNSEITAGFNNMFKNEKPDGYIKLPDNLKRVDFFCRVEGNSMYPKYKSGDLIGLRKLQSNLGIPFGEVYVVITQDFRMLKIITKSEKNNCYQMVSINKLEEYKSYDVPLKEIKMIFKVEYCIAIE